MASRLILDAGVLIGLERGELRAETLFEGDDDIAVAAITLAELEVGVLSSSAAHRPARAAFLAGIPGVMQIEPYDDSTASEHARLLVETARVGRPRGSFDLVLAATAARTRRTILTTDAVAAFGELPGVSCTVLRSPRGS